MSNLTLAIGVLEKELERTNLLIMAGKMEDQKKKDFGDAYKGPAPIYEEGHSTRMQLRDQLENAIAYLKTKSYG